MITALAGGLTPEIISLAFGVSFLGSYITICLADQLRISTLNANTSPKLFGRQAIICLMTLSLGGIAIFGMHIIGVTGANMMRFSDFAPVIIRYNVFATLMTLVGILFCSYLGIYISSLDTVFTKSKGEIIEMFVATATNSMTMSSIKKMSNSKILFIISTHNLYHLMIGGVWIGCAMFIMHYTGTLGFTGSMDGGATFQPIKIIWYMPTFIPSLILAWIFGTLSFWVLFRLLSLYCSREILRIFSASFMAGSVTGFHFLAMTGCGVQFDTSYNPSYVSTAYFEQKDTFTACLSAIVLLAFLVCFIVLCELRHYFSSLTLQLKKADDCITQLQQQEPNLMYSPVVSQYLLQRNTFSASLLQSSGSGGNSSTTTESQSSMQNSKYIKSNKTNASNKQKQQGNGNSLHYSFGSLFTRRFTKHNKVCVNEETSAAGNKEKKQDVEGVVMKELATHC